MNSVRCLSFLFVLVFAGFFISCEQETKTQKFRIGFSQCGDDDKWRKSMLAEMKRELSFHPEFEFIYKQANNNNEQQIKDVKELLGDDIDLLIISPNEALPLTPVVEDVFNRGIPVIVVDRKIATGMYTNYIGADNYQIGKMAGEYVGALLKGRGNVIQVTGLPGSSPAIERDRGFRNGVARYPDIKILGNVHGNWVKPVAREALSLKQDLLDDADLVFAHNDVMALGAYEASRAIGKYDMKVIGVDALPGKGTGMETVAEKILTASLLYPTGGAEAIQNAANILAGRSLEKETILQTLVVDSSNVRMMKLQSDKMLSQEQDIQHQQKMIAEQKRVYNNQRTFVYFLICSLCLVIIFAALLYHSWHINKKMNRKLALQNEEISHKSELLIEMSARAQAAHDARLNFFTNISHEFRTPLTLLLGPMDEMIHNPKTQAATKTQVVTMRKNVLRLMRLVSQLIDFRKVEFNKWKVKASETDLVQFTNEIVQAFQEVAKKRNIDCRLLTKETSLPVWLDNTMIDKVLFNLLSNAFKFTSDNGSILVSLIKKAEDNQVNIKVEDNGVGMSREDLEHVFELFYQGDFESHKGSGIGLALSKELLLLHHGDITATSVKGKGTTFIISLPLGKDHFNNDELLEENLSSNFVDDHGRLFTTDLYPTIMEVAGEASKANGAKEASVLIVEDNPELRKFIAGKLCSEYNIIEAENGNEGLVQAFEALPDIILCDIMMPGKDGLTLIRQLKEDIRTSHIPIIILSARVAIEAQLEGLQNLADAYFTKPFNFLLLSQTIRSLLLNRLKTKEHFSSEIPAEINNTATRADRTFIATFRALVESNIANDEFSIDDICRGMNISKVHLHRKIKTLMNISVNEYILTTRIQKARYYLKHEDMTIAQVAYQTGFTSPAYFSTVFKSKTGISPTVYKDQKK